MKPKLVITAAITYAVPFTPPGPTPKGLTVSCLAKSAPIADRSPSEKNGQPQRTNLSGHGRHVHTDPPAMDQKRRSKIVNLCIDYTYPFPHRNSQTGNNSHTPGARSREIVAHIRHHAGKHISPGRQTNRTVRGIVNHRPFRIIRAPGRNQADPAMPILPTATTYPG